MPAAVRALIRRGADPNARDECGRTPSWIAAWHGFDGVLETLKDGGADLDLSDGDGETPLSAAARRGRLNTVRARVLPRHGILIVAKQRETCVSDDEIGRL